MSAFVTQTITLSREEAATIQQISTSEHLPEDILLKKFILDSVARYRRQQAVQAYRRGKLDLSRAAHYANISVYDMMDELHGQGISLNRSVEKFLDGLENFINAFPATGDAVSDDEQVLRQAIASLREQPELLAEPSSPE